jgi:hypothetical protein
MTIRTAHRNSTPWPVGSPISTDPKGNKRLFDSRGKVYFDEMAILTTSLPAQ